MCNTVRRLAAFLLFLCSLHCLSVTAAELDRPYDPVVIYGSQMSELLHTPVSELRVYIYHADTEQWEPIPFQIDEVDQVWSYFESSYNGVLDEFDEIVFMAHDLGDLAPEDEWATDATSKTNPRYLFTITDNVGGTQSAYACIYRSASLDLDNTWYMYYPPADDYKVEGESYVVSHAPGPEWILQNYLSISPRKDLNILDRQKFRIYAIYHYLLYIWWVDVNIYIDENTVSSQYFNRANDALRKKGPIRYIYEASLIMWGGEGSTTFEDTLSITTRYYPHFSYLSTGDNEIKEIQDLDLRRLRISFDYNQNAIGMKYYSPYNQGGYPIDGGGSPGEINTSLNWPGDTEGVNWNLIVADPDNPTAEVDTASILAIMKLRGTPIGNSCQVYYRDSVNPEDRDTGDLKHYGENGILFADNDNIQGTLGLTYWSFYLPQNLSYAEAEALVPEAVGGLEIESILENYDTIPPAKITDIIVYSTGDNSVTLRFDAPGDDGMTGGSAEYYDLRYHTGPIGADTTAWWNTASRVVNEPVPAPPGVQQEIVIPNLSMSTTYYFLLVSYDNVGNASYFSSAISGISAYSPLT